jgi:hypothetical protein
VERPSRHAKLGVRNAEIVGDRGGLSALLLQNNPSQRKRDGPFDACARKRSLVRGGSTVKGPSRRLTPYLLVSPFLQRGHPAHGRYEGMRRNSTTR